MIITFDKDRGCVASRYNVSLQKQALYLQECFFLACLWLFLYNKWVLLVKIVELCFVELLLWGWSER